VWLDGDKVDVTLRFDKECIPLIVRKKWHQSQKEKTLKDGRLEVRFRVTGLEDIKRWIYRWIPYVEVAAPVELKEAVRKNLKEAVKKV
jgi:predicted DNA-binding transcriptional regulator YafY